MITPKTEIRVHCPRCHLLAFIVTPLTNPPQPPNIKFSHKCRQCKTVFEFPGESETITRMMIDE